MQCASQALVERRPHTHTSRRRRMHSSRRVASSCGARVVSSAAAAAALCTIVRSSCAHRKETRTAATRRRCDYDDDDNGDALERYTFCTALVSCRVCVFDKLIHSHTCGKRLRLYLYGSVCARVDCVILRLIAAVARLLHRAHRVDSTGLLYPEPHSLYYKYRVPRICAAVRARTSVCVCVRVRTQYIHAQCAISGARQTTHACHRD